MPRSLGLFEQLGDAVQRQAGAKLAQVASLHLEGFSRWSDPPALQAMPQDVVHRISEGPARSPCLGLQLGGDVLVQGESGSHAAMLGSRHVDVKRWPSRGKVPLQSRMRSTDQ